MLSRPLLVSLLALACAGLFGVTACTAGSGNGTANKGDDDDDDDDAKTSTKKSPSSADDDDDDDDDDTTSKEKCDYPAAQGPTEPCCPDLGIDACGAKLFCAALEGRKVAVCYAERSSKSGEDCKEDRECQSEKCIDKKCAFYEGAECPGPTAKCVPASAATTKPVVCARSKREAPYTYTCTLVGSSNIQCRACATAADCGGGAGVECTENTCLYSSGGNPPACF
jgi:hypothetical protein